MYISAIHKSGRSCKLHIPTQLANKLNLRPGDHVTVELDTGGALLITPIADKLTRLKKPNGGRSDGQQNATCSNRKN